MARKGGYRHLIYFIDGTWLWAGSDNSLDVYSNIYRLDTLLNPDGEDGHAQIIHYARGLGAVRGLRQYTAGGFSYGIDEMIADLYVNICSNYERGDRIYLFGFSRGAVVARALTGLLSCGILEAKHINLFAHVWAAYTGDGEVIVPGQPKQLTKEKPINYEPFCSARDPKIEFVGVFDTVSGGHAISAIGQRLRLNQRHVQSNVKHAVHLLAIDETRTFFRPILWTGFEKSKRPSSSNQTLEQIWMPGVHSDVGGAYSKRHLGNLALLTMIDRAIARTSLSFDLNQCKKLEVRSEDLVRIHNEFTRVWRFLSGESARKVQNVSREFIHPFALYLNQKIVSFKRINKSTPYRLPPEFAKLPVAKEFLSSVFKSNCV
jgi:uncharacterized protein (DUF2235 family)